MSARSRFDRWYRDALNGNGRVHHWWWVCSDRGYAHLWRPACWLRGYHVPHHTDVHFEMCSYCGKSLWSRTRDRGLNPFIRPLADRAPLRRRRAAGTGAER